ncbi:Imidazoleglycerol-phosphate dehydratase [archaeon HR05]|nr:Imidazoleglycerol-phosphate dehydratase [archaeon HR05]
MQEKERRSRVERYTNETSVEVEVDLDGNGLYSVETGIRFLDHMIASISKHSLIDIRLKGVSKDGIRHHLIEDVAITLASALDKALGGRDGIERFGYAMVPMDDALAFVALDLVRRAYHAIDLKLVNGVEDMVKEDIEHFFTSFALNLNACIHVVVQYGSNDHHKVEAACKALGVALRNAAVINPRKGIASTKGTI